MPARRNAEFSAAPFVPANASVDQLANAAASCTGCPLYEGASATVFGEGATRPRLMLVGEQPGDQEDRQGHPFVGPAGGVLWACLRDAEIDRDDVYATNAVKHFKFERRGNRRIHQRPTTAEVEACHPWLLAELAAVEPYGIVALGATAARSVLGRSVPIAKSRGLAFALEGRPVFVSYHPSAVLRADEAAAEIRAALVEDLGAAWAAVGPSGGRSRPESR